MNTGQMMIGIFALGLVSFTILNFNKGSISTQDALIYNKEFIVATTIAQSMLDEINGKAYDEVIVNGTSILSSNNFSANLQADPSENYPNFDDIDDYNNFTRTDEIPEMGTFNIMVEVNYMTDDFVPTSVRTYNKNVIVKITSPTLVNFFTQEEDTLVLTSLYSQWTMI